MKLRDFICVALIAIFTVFLSVTFFSPESPAYAEDGTPLFRTDATEFFVTIYDQGESLIVKTRSATVSDILSRSKIQLAETDLVEPGLDTVVDSDFNINIYRARPAIIIDGTEKHYLMTASHDPYQIALEAGLTVYDGDTVTAIPNANFLEAGIASSYRLTRNGGRTVTISESLSYVTETRYDFNLDKGLSYLEQAGEDGRRVSVYEVSFADNVEIGRSLISEEITLEPVPEIIVVGAKLSIPPEQQECASWAREAGVSELDLDIALELIYRESGCRVDATNPSSGAYGIPQSLPGSKMASEGADWATNPVTQIRWMAGYVVERYGGWREARDFWYCTGLCYSRLGPVTKNGYWY